MTCNICSICYFVRVYSGIDKAFYKGSSTFNFTPLYILCNMHDYIDSDIAKSEQWIKEDVNVVNAARVCVCVYMTSVATFRKITYASDKCKMLNFRVGMCHGFGQIRDRQIGKRISLVSISQPRYGVRISTFTFIFIGTQNCPWSSEWKIISPRVYDADYRLSARPRIFAPLAIGATASTDHLQPDAGL